MLKNVSKFTTILIFVLNSLIQGFLETYPISYNNAHPIKFYQSEIILVPKESTNTIEKRSLLGALVWSHKVSAPISFFDSQFNQIFILDKKGYLTVLDYTTGFKKWSITDQEIMFIRLNYPQLICHTKSNYIASISFADGNILWQKKLAPIKDFAFIGHSGKAGILYQQSLDIIDLFEGTTSRSISLPKPVYKIETTWNNGLVIAGKFARYHVNIDTNSVLPLTISESLYQWIQEKYILTYDSTREILSLRDITTNQPQWSESVSSSLTSMMVSKRDILLHYSPSQNEIISFMTSNRKRTPIKLPNGNLNAFYRSPNSFSFLIDNFIIYHKIPMTNEK